MAECVEKTVKDWPILGDAFGHKSAIFYQIWKFLGSLERRHQALSNKPKKKNLKIFSENSSIIAYNRAIARKNRAIMVKIALLIADNRAIFTRNRRATFTRVGWFAYFGSARLLARGE